MVKRGAIKCQETNWQFKKKDSSQTYNKNRKISIDYEQLYETLKEDYMNIFNDVLKKIEEKEREIESYKKKKRIKFKIVCEKLI